MDLECFLALTDRGRGRDTLLPMRDTLSECIPPPGFLTLNSLMPSSESSHDKSYLFGMSFKLSTHLLLPECCEVDANQPTVILLSDAV